MKRIIVLLGLFLMGAILFGCAPKAMPTAPLEEKPAEVAAPVTKTGWEGEWERILKEARKEGTVVIYSTAGSDIRAMISRRFKEAYGIEAQHVVGRGAELSQKLLTERRVGIYLGDVYLAGMTTQVNVLKPKKILDPLRPVLILPEVTDTRFWYQNRLPFLDNDDMLLGFRISPSNWLYINTKLVKDDEIKSYRDLLEPKWKGKIILNDPTIAGTGARFFSVIGGVLLDMDYMYQLARQEPAVVRDQRLQGLWLSQGKYAIGLALKNDVVGEFIREGAPIKPVMPKEGVAAASGAGILSRINNAPHPNATKIFINWFLTREIQHEYSKLAMQPSSREDVPTDHLLSVDIRVPGFKYFISDNEDFLKKEPEFAKKAQEIFGHLLR